MTINLINQENNCTMNEIESFLRGYFYGRMLAEDYGIYHNNGCNIVTKNGGDLYFVINSGICPKNGNITFAFNNPDESDVAITSEWTTHEIWNYILEKIDVEYNEVRVDLKFLCQLIDDFGGIDFENMKNDE